MCITPQLTLTLVPFQVQANLRKNKKLKWFTEHLLPPKSKKAFWCSLPFATVLDMLKVAQNLSQPSHDRMATLIIMARREKKKAAIPKFSPTVVRWEKRTELQVKVFSCESLQNEKQLTRQRHSNFVNVINKHFVTWLIYYKCDLQKHLMCINWSKSKTFQCMQNVD